MVCEFAAVVDDGVALVAGEADALCLVELAAEVGDLAADAFVIEVPALGALGAEVFVPGFAAIVVGYGDDVTEGDVGGLQAVEVSVEGAEA